MTKSRNSIQPWGDWFQLGQKVWDLPHLRLRDKAVWQVRQRWFCRVGWAAWWLISSLHLSRAGEGKLLLFPDQMTSARTCQDLSVAGEGTWGFTSLRWTGKRDFLGRRGALEWMTISTPKGGIPVFLASLYPAVSVTYFFSQHTDKTCNRDAVGWLSPVPSLCWLLVSSSLKWDGHKTCRLVLWEFSNTIS